MPSGKHDSFYMKARIQKRLRKRLIKIFLFAVIIVALFIGVGYIWFVHNSKRLLIDLVDKRSSGKLKLDLADVIFDFIDDEVKIHKAEIASTSGDQSAISYRVAFSRVTLHTNSIWSLLFNRSLRIKQVKVYDPIIEVDDNHLTNDIDSTKTLSIGTELGKIYNSIQDGLTELKTHSIYINNATLILNNKSGINKKPIIFSNIYFTLKKLNKFNKAGIDYLENNNIEFRSSNQSITFSDGIHQLLFKKLSIQQARSILLDSCTIIALPAHSSGSSYRINFTKLALIGVDFKQLYLRNLIKADSVYCQNPVCDILLTTKDSAANIAGKGVPDIEKIIKIFSGNLDLGFVGVNNADIHLKIKGKKLLSNIHSGKVNFKIENLRIDPDSSSLISMSNFNMMVKGYHLYNADSSCIYSFDSVRFANDRLLLNNVTIHTTSGKDKVRNYRDYTMSYFALTGIDWSELIFRQNIKATEAILYNPTINFIKNKNAEVAKKSLLFNSHHTFDDFMEIEKLKIINGSVNLNWGEDNSLQLRGLNLGVYGDNIADYKHVRLHKDIESFFFSDGLLKIGDLNAQLRNVTFKENNQVHAAELLIKNKNGKIDSRIENVSIGNIYSEKNTGNFVIDGLSWNGGLIKLSPAAGGQKKHRTTSILLKNISAMQTSVQVSKSGVQLNAFINKLQIASLLKSSAKPITLHGLQLDGEDATAANTFFKI